MDLAKKNPNTSRIRFEGALTKSRFTATVRWIFLIRVTSLKFRQMLRFLTPTVACLALFSILSSTPVLAWDDAGHKITTVIAWKNMTPTARARAVEILMAAPEDSMLSAFYSGDSRPEATRKLELFMIASTWPDMVRDRNFPTRYGKYHKSSWHYADTFWTEENGTFKTLGNVAGEGGLAVEKILEFEKLLADPASQKSDKAIALAWILHLVGDIHQPLHASARVTDLEPKGDQGGNLFLLTPRDTPREKQMSLHWFIDSIVGRNIERRDACDSDYLFPIADAITKTYPMSMFRDQSSDGADKWQQESVSLTQREVFTSELIRFQTPTDEYRKQIFKISEKRLAQAGYRMATLLNRALDGGK
jgi:hypothetical protein